MENKNRKDLLALFCSVSLISCLLGLLWWTRNLVQSNPEELFLSKHGLNVLNRFNHTTGAGRILFLSFDKSAFSPEYDFNQIHSLLSQWAETAPVNNVQSNANIQNQPLNSQKHKHLPKPLFDWQNNEHWSAMLSFDQDHKGQPLAQSVDSLLTLFKMKGFKAEELPHLAGMPAVNLALNQASVQIGNTLFPLLFAASYLFCWLILKNFLSASLLFASSLAGPAIGLFLLKINYGNMDMITSIAPVLLFILNLSMGFHLHYSFAANPTLRDTFREKLPPLILMTTTTMVGLFSLVASEIESISRFGFISGFGLLISSLLHILIFICGHILLDNRVTHREPRMLDPIRYKRWFRSFKMAYIIPLVVVIFCATPLAWQNIEVESEAVFYFEPQHWLRQDQKIIETRLLGNPNFDVLIKLVPKDQEQYSPWEKHALLKPFVQLEQKILSSPIFKNQVLLSPVQLLSALNFLYSGNLDLPPHDFAQVPLVSYLPESVRTQYASHSYYRFTLLGQHVKNDQYKLMTEELEKSLQGFEYELTGPYFAMRSGQMVLLKTLFLSFFSSMIVILIGSCFFFRNTRYFLSFFLVNILPSFLTIIVMALSGISFNVATIMTFSISLGMVVDGTFHLSHDYARNINREKIVKQTVSPMVFSTILLVICFALFGFNHFLPIRQFGPVLSIGLFTGLLCDLFLLERLLGIKA